MNEFIEITITDNKGLTYKIKFTSNNIVNENNEPLDISDCSYFYSLFREINKAFVAYGVMILEKPLKDMMNI